MGSSDREVYVHLVWATKSRQPTIPPELERPVIRILNSEARKLGCRIIAANGTEDHFHVLVHVGPQVGLARIVNQLKGVTALFINDRRPDESTPIFRWQAGYGAFSIAKQQIDVVARYIACQKEHHANGSVWESLEPPDDVNTDARSI